MGCRRGQLCRLRLRLFPQDRRGNQRDDESNRQRIVVKGVPVRAGEPFVPNERKREELSITRRELEVLELIAQGMSNREIAGKLYVSENTVKTQSSRVFDKLGAKRRTQAVQLGKEFGVLP